MTESTSRAPRAFPWRPVLAFMTGWALLFWGIIGLFVAPLLPGGWLGVLALAVLGLAPFALFVRRMTRGEYPGRLTRLLVMRPFWYTQLGLPLVAAGGLVGAIV